MTSHECGADVILNLHPVAIRASTSLSRVGATATLPKADDALAGGSETTNVTVVSIKLRQVSIDPLTAATNTISVSEDKQDSISNNDQEPLSKM